MRAGAILLMCVPEQHAERPTTHHRFNVSQNTIREELAKIDVYFENFEVTKTIMSPTCVH